MKRARRVLVVEDNPDTASSFVAVLELLGHTAAAITDPRGAVDLAKTFQPDIAFFDIGMPHVDGYQLAELFRNTPELKRTCLVAITAYNEEEDRIKSRKSGFDAHIAKPARIEIIEAIIAQFE
jgi:CheY-like chemotaxis protein